LWFMVYGSWFLVYGFWFLVSGFWLMVCDVECRLESEQEQEPHNLWTATPSGDTTPCKVTPVILHGVVSQNPQTPCTPSGPPWGLGS
jgi:hypothetical protein